MTILHISDTHSQHRRLTQLPDADILVHSGDFTMNGSEQEAIDFMNWFCDLPYSYKIFICGNHDACLYEAKIDGLDKNVYYLCNSGVTIHGVRFYGVPMFMEDCISDRQRRNYATIPAYQYDYNRECRYSPVRRIGRYYLVSKEQLETL
ncbi:metallophosphoesterase [Bacteroides mediterraneensis]|nr:metallophosphoesterase [Bacteroides mediterraneensis]